VTTYLALLRAVNVGGANALPMAGLRALFEDLGHDRVRTYLQSGNVVFEAGSSAKLAEDLEAAMADAFDLDVSVILRTRTELARVVAANPWPQRGGKALHVMFLAQRVPARRLKSLDPGRSPPDEFKVGGREIFLFFPRGSGRSKLTVDYFESRLGTRATARNWNTVTKLLQMMEG
jgi:uncharacterized protein (DUF1697 family)